MRDLSSFQFMIDTYEDGYRKINNSTQGPSKKQENSTNLAQGCLIGLYFKTPFEPTWHD